MTQEQGPAGLRPPTPPTLLREVTLPKFFILLFVVVALAVTTGLFLFYYVIVRAFGMEV
jgi:hypothetical protein